jgi:chemotaxis protein MotB
MVESGSEHWSVPWSDLMMVMFVLFAVLVALQMRENRELVETANRQQPVPLSVPQPVPEEVPTAAPSFEPLMRVNVFERSQDAVRETRVENVEIVLMNDRSVKVSVQGPMFFGLGEATLSPEVREFLDRLARVIGQTLFAVRVVGHTDDYPVETEAYPSNWELSAARAARVARYLIDSGGLDPRRFTVLGRGEYEPAVPNRDDANRALNRRVEIIITRDEVEPLDQAGIEAEPDSQPDDEVGSLIEAEVAAGPARSAAADEAPEPEGSAAQGDADVAVESRPRPLPAPETVTVTDSAKDSATDSVTDSVTDDVDPSTPNASSTEPRR